MRCLPESIRTTSAHPVDQAMTAKPMTAPANHSVPYALGISASLRDLANDFALWAHEELRRCGGFSWIGTDSGLDFLACLL